jgi:hypothetical protein
MEYQLISFINCICNQFSITASGFTFSGVCKGTENSLIVAQILKYPGASSSSLMTETYVMTKAFNRIASSVTNERLNVAY